MYTLLTIIITAKCGAAIAQNADDARSLIKEGMQLNKDGKCEEAIVKYNAALKIDPSNLFADYQVAVAYFTEGLGDKGIPYLKLVIKGNSTLAAPVFDLLGSIYMKGHDPKKAIETYREGLKVDSNNQSLHFSLSTAYWGTRQYAEAEIEAATGIKLNPSFAANHRTYALTSFHQNKRAQALLGLCSFILADPKGGYTKEPYTNIQHVLQGGALKPEPGEAAPHAADVNTTALNQAITQAVAPIAKNKYATAADLLTAQVKAIFITIGQLAEKQTGNDFFRKYMAAYFYQLAQSPNLPAFARLISASTPESAQWIKDNPQPMADLDSWVKRTERSF